ncbi:hypothetical protein AHMF7605_04050 [Adhaeribacter arboris]|uniref:Uncharacterized protein n=1 Tax=Adhaeribacter arboris TaxID=2072846 RepID=A0A2T2YB46_9BACT|nr:hypothetical protein [Adhaeribacter arboris]PSR52750.1 hypothetical protein AHMF7605_04050 [Adhaeribacter arboris]
MLKNFITLLNCLILSTWSLAMGFLSLLSIGTIEDHERLVREPFRAFLLRFSVVGLVGLFGILILIFFNFLLNRSLLKNSQPVNLKKYFITSFVITLSICLAGTLLFILN